MTDIDAKIAALEGLRGVMGDAWVDAEIAKLRVAPPPTSEQAIKASDGAVISDATQANIGGDLRDGAIGQGNMVLHNIRVEAGGSLVVGALAAALPPDPEAVRRALASYLRTLLGQYRLLNLQGMGANEAHKLQVTIQSVFINLLTDHAPLANKFGYSERPSSRLINARIQTLDDALHSNDKPLIDPTTCSPDDRAWIEELTSEDERALLYLPLDQLKKQTGVGQESGDMSDRDVEQQIQQLMARLSGPRTAIELVRHEPALVLLGDPGSGKSTVLRYLALGFAAARLQVGEQDAPALDATLAWTGTLPVPVLVQLRRFATTLKATPLGAEPLLHHLEQVLSSNRLDALARYLEQLLERGEALVLLDGLDEIGDDQQRLWTVQAIAALQRRFPQSRIVVTCRGYAYREPYMLPTPFVSAHVQPLNQGEQNAFIARWYSAALLSAAELPADACAAEAQRRSQGLSGALDARPRLRELTTNPLLLTMVVLLNWKRTTLPQQRAELYAECLNVLLEQWEQRHAEGEPAGLAATLGVAEKLSDTGSRLALVQPVAYELQLAGREEARQHEVTNWLLPRFIDLADDDGKRAKALITQFLSFLEGRSGLLIARDLRDRYAFPHKTFQEYLAARELVYRGGDDLLQQVKAQRHAPTWREVILLAAGHLVASGQPAQARQIAWELVDADDEGSPGYWRSAALAGEIVDELRGNLGPDGRRLRDEVVRRLVAMLQGGQLSAAERVAAGLTLGHLGDPRPLFPDRAGFWCEVPAGSFWFGDDREDDREGVLQQVELPYSFHISRFPVTNALFAQFIEAQGGAYDPHHPCWTEQGRRFLVPGGHQWDNQKEWVRLPRLWHNPGFNQPNQPVVGVSWYEAAAFCRWLSERERAAGRIGINDEIRLPTSLEWEHAARGDDDRRFPWGNEEPTPEHANYRDTQINAPSPVGCFPRGCSPFDLHDMAGNVMEWLATPNGKDQQVGPGKDFTPNDSVLQSYSEFSDTVENLCCGARDRSNPDVRYGFQGFRIMWSRARIV